MKSLFICEDGPGIGFGHMSRCIAIARGLAERGWQCRFATSQTSADSWMLNDSGFETIVLTTFDDPAKSLPGEIAVWGPDLIVLDSYKFGNETEKSLRHLAPWIMTLSDAPDRRFHSDILLDGTPGRLRDEYLSLVPSGCELLTGAGYLPLSGTYEKARWSAPREDSKGEEMPRLFATFGGADSIGAGPEFLTAVEGLARRLEIHLVVGGGTIWRQQLEEQAGSTKHDIHLHFDAKDVLGIMLRCNLAVGSSGVNAMERCAIGLPSILICVAQNQQPNFDRLVSADAVVGLNYDSGDFRRELADRIAYLLDHSEACKQLSENALALCDGGGVRRITDRIVQLIENTGRQHD